MRDKFFDIKHPEDRAATPRITRVPRDLPYIPLWEAAPKWRRDRSSFLVPLGAFLLILVVFGLNLFQFKQNAADSAPKIYANFKEGAKALFGFDLEKARDSFGKANQQLANLNSQAPFKTVPAILDNLFKLSQSAVDLSGQLTDLKSNGLSMLIGKKGALIIQSFHNAQNQLASIGQLSSQLKTEAADAGYQLGPEFQNMSNQINEADKFLTAFLNWLETPKKQRLLIFFQNPSEMRPAGGFIGSYGMATLFQGNLLDLQVRDIYDPDGQLKVKVIPPKPLQGITDKWGARDANWFFDFPTSAAKVADFLETSRLYADQQIKFSGAVAINIETLKDILEVTGPVDLPEYRTTIDSGNFLKKIQAEVESGEDNVNGEPKRILKVLTPIIFEKISGLNADQRQQLFEKFARRFVQKDILVYFRDPVIEDYLKKLGAAGEVMALPEKFAGDYLAVVNASVAGGKSDAVIDQTIKLTSNFGVDGGVHDRLVIIRTHRGDRETDWWYRATNHDYLQIFTPPGARLEDITGATAKTITPPVSYDNSFVKDGDLAAMEKKGAAVFGKSVFTAWLDTKAGATKKISFDYLTPYRFNFQPGPYRFVFEKQSGFRGKLDLELNAPAGYQWQESGSPKFTYSTNDPPARIVLDLNLQASPRP